MDRPPPPPSVSHAPAGSSPATLQSLFRLLLPDVPAPTPPLLTISEAQLLLNLLHAPASSNPHQLAALALAELCHLSRPTMAKALELDIHLDRCFAAVVDDWIRHGTADERCRAVGFACRLVEVVPSAAVRILGRPRLLLDLFAAASSPGEPSSSTAPYVPPSPALPLALTALLGHLIGFKDGIALLLQSDVDVPRWLEEQYQNTAGNLELRAKAAGVRVRLGRELLATVGEDNMEDDADDAADDDDDERLLLDGAQQPVGVEEEERTVRPLPRPRRGTVDAAHADLDGRMQSVTLSDDHHFQQQQQQQQHHHHHHHHHHQHHQQQHASHPQQQSVSHLPPPQYELLSAAAPASDAEDDHAHLADASFVSVASQQECDEDTYQPSEDGATIDGSTSAGAGSSSKQKRKKKKKRKSKAKAASAALAMVGELAQQDGTAPLIQVDPVADVGVFANGDTVSEAGSRNASSYLSELEEQDELALAAAHVEDLLAEWVVFATQKRAGRTVLSIAQGVAILDKHRALAPAGASKVFAAFFGLAGLSTRDAVKDLLAANVQFLGCLFNLLCSCGAADTALLVAMCTILYNLVAFRPSVQQGLECPARDPPELAPPPANDEERYQRELMQYFWRQDSAVIRRAERLVSASIISILVRVSQQYGAEVAQVIGPTIRALAEIEGAREELRKEGGPLAALWMMSQMLPAAPKSGKQDQVLGQLEGALLQTLHGLALMVTGATKAELEAAITPVEDLVAPICLLLFTDRDILPGLLKADALAALKSLTCCGPGVTDEIASFHGYELMRFLERLLVGQDYYLCREANALIYCLFHSHSAAAFRYLELPTPSSPPSSPSTSAAAGAAPAPTAKAQGKRPARPPASSASRGWHLLNLLLSTASSAANDLSVRLCASATLTDVITAHPAEACAALLDHPTDTDGQRARVVRGLLALFARQEVRDGALVEHRVHAGLVDRGAFILLNTLHSCAPCDPLLLPALQAHRAAPVLQAALASVRAVRAGALEGDLGRPGGDELRRELGGKLRLVLALLEGRSLEDISWRVLGA